MIKEFREYTESNLTESLGITAESDIEWMALAQHYGIPTPLLDWTTDPLVALFFSATNDTKLVGNSNLEEAIADFESNHYSNKGAAIFVMNPGKYNSVVSEIFYSNSTKTIDFPLDMRKHSKILENYQDKSGLPCAIMGVPLDKRIVRQSGNFTIHGRMVWPVDYRAAQEVIYKIFIPHCVYKEIHKVLDTLNINHSSIYLGESERDIKSKEISREAKEQLYEKIDELLEKYKNNFSVPIKI
nr:FRG domain-containing protein [Bacillus cereus]